MVQKRKRDNKATSHSRKKARRDIGKDELGYTQSKILHPVLNSYYADVKTLRGYLLDILSTKSRSAERRLILANLDESFSFLDDCLVGCVQKNDQLVQERILKEYNAYLQSSSHLKTAVSPIDNVISFVIWTTFQRSGTTYSKSRNVLCQGLQRKILSSNVKQEIGGQDTAGNTYEYPNENINSIKAKPWTYLIRLLGRHGQAIIATLLLECGFFLRLPGDRDNFYQISGFPISELPPIVKNFQSPIRVVKKDNQKPFQLQKICFVRYRMFYAKPLLNTHGRVQFGLKHIHVLERYSDSHDRNHTIHILKYIFPRQFHLHNVFTSKVDRKQTAQSFKDYTYREDEINEVSKGSRVPKRLRGYILKLVQKLQRNHKQCPYSQLLLHYCPLRSKSLIEAHNMSSQGRDVDNQLLHSADESEAAFFPHATPVSQVSTFCEAVFRRLLPSDSFGSGPLGKQNWKLISLNIYRFIAMRKYESFNLHELLQGLHLKCISWLQCDRVNGGEKLSLSDKQKRSDLFSEFLYYVFDSLLIPLVRSNFYVTESGVYRNKLFYFRHDVWKKLSEPCLRTLRSTTYQILKPSEARRILNSRTLGYSQVRLLPKARGTRTITNLRRRVIKTFGQRKVLGSSINTQLAPLFSVLNYERLQNPSISGGALLSVGELHEKLRSFRRIINPGSKLYFVKMDIRSCFDTIPQIKLLELIKCLLQQQNYKTTRHAELKSSENGQNIRRRFIGTARAVDDVAVFSENAAEELSRRKHGIVFTEYGQQKTWQVGQLLKLLQEHIRNNIVKIGKKYARQKTGIPQGSILSSLLCTLFYTHFEHQRLPFLDPTSSLLLRLIDDFLLITTDKNVALDFVQVLAKGDANYGISVNVSKTLTNFDMMYCHQKIPRLHGTLYFPYCGMGIEMHTLEMRKDREKKDLFIGNALTVDTTRKPGATLRRKVVSSLKLQMHSMLLDDTMNSRNQIITTLIGNFTESAMKMHQYIKTLVRKGRPQAELVISLIEELILVAIQMSQTKRTSFSKEVRDHSITGRQMCWIAATSFDFVLRRKQSDYRSVITWLQSLKQDNISRMGMNQTELGRLLQENYKAFYRHIY